jgi:Tfp pilus assembly protein PilV
MRYKGNLVLLELLIALAFFAVSAVIGAGVLASAYRIGMDSRHETDALFVAQNWAERIAAADDPVAPLKAQGAGVDGNYRFEDGDYTVVASVNPEDTGAGTLYDIRLTVSRGDKALAQLPASRYVPEGVPK